MSGIASVDREGIVRDASTGNVDTLLVYIDNYYIFTIQYGIRHNGIVSSSVNNYFWGCASLSRFVTPAYYTCK